MARATKIIRNLYRDSVSLMQLSAALARLDGIEQASAVIASPSNLALLREVGLLGEAAITAGPNDLLIALLGRDEPALTVAIAAAAAALAEQPVATSGNSPGQMAPRSIAMGRETAPAANLALISTPGEYAAAEAFKALRLGLNVMLFSDNVSLDDEVALKRYANERDLIVMGPDCGTAIINGVPLAFANVVRRGVIGCVAASGTGLQQVTCLVDRLGAGISQAIGTGGHDLHHAVGGISMLRGLKALADDPATKVIVLISKPPSPEVAEQVVAAASRAEKPIIVNFLGADPGTITRPNLYPAVTLEDAARAAVALASGLPPGGSASDALPVDDVPFERFEPRYVRGLYSGGTFCYEASLLLGQSLGRVWSNTPVDSKDRLADVWTGREHTVIDLGDDVFTRGRPHPMIDHRLRNDRISAEAADPEVAVVLFDVVLGYGSHPDPASEMVPVIEKAHAAAAARGQSVAFVGFVCGTPGDPQSLSRQEAALREVGVLLADSNAAAVRLAARIIRRGFADAL